MPNVKRLVPEAKARAAALAALDQMYGYYAFDWKPFPHALAKAA
ncbi:hypothetical protein [Paragemmobacter kunshanensis]|nr:hypothetical protein [Rhodobacter kunshanensis]